MTKSKAPLANNGNIRSPTPKDGHGGRSL